MTETIQDGKVVTLHYTLKLDSGQAIDSSRSGEPLKYLHGANNIVPGLEEALAGKAAGDKIDVTVPADKAYGPRNPQAHQVVPRSAFPPDVELEPGMQFGVRDEQGRVMPVWVTQVGEEQVTIDLNHPLAGETLHFDVEVMEVRDATAEESAHGHPHGPGGHSHDE